MEIKQVATPLSLEALAETLRLEARAQGITDRVTLEMLGGLVGIENGQGKKIRNHNWGNVMATKEWIDAGKPFYSRPHADPQQPQAFRSYPSHQEGARAWLKLLRGPRHGRALEIAATGDAEEFADSLFRSAYIVPVRSPGAPSEAAQRESYAKGIFSIARRLHELKAFGKETSPVRYEVFFFPSLRPGLGLRGEGVGNER